MRVIFNEIKNLYRADIKIERNKDGTNIWNKSCKRSNRYR